MAGASFAAVTAGEEYIADALKRMINKDPSEVLVLRTFFYQLLSGYLTVRHGIDDPSIDDFPSLKSPFSV